MYSYPSHEDPSHTALIRRLEARHCHRLLEAGDVRGPQWPWRSRLITPKVGSPEGESAEHRGYSSEDGFGGGRLDIVGLVDAHPGPRGNPLGDEYTDGDLALMDWIRERAVPLRRLRRKLDRSYPCSAGNQSRRSLLAAMKEEGGWGGGSGTDGVEREEASLAVNSPRQSLSAAARDLNPSQFQQMADVNDLNNLSPIQ